MPGFELDVIVADVGMQRLNGAEAAVRSDRLQSTGAPEMKLMENITKRKCGTSPRVNLRFHEHDQERPINSFHFGASGRLTILLPTFTMMDDSAIESIFEH